MIELNRRGFLGGAACSMLYAKQALGAKAPTYNGPPDPYVIVDDLNQVPWGGNAYPNGKTISTPRLTIGQNTKVIVVAGQSNCCDTNEGTYSPVNSSVIDNFNIYDAGTYIAADPLLGCTIKSTTTLGNLFLRCADNLITASWCDRVILAPIGYSGTVVATWETGALLNPRLYQVCQRLAAVGLTPDVFIWMQGESDNTNGTLQAAYTASLSQVLATPLAFGFTAPWLVGVCTYISGTTWAPVQTAQAAAVDNITVFAGADTDTLTGTAVYRQADDTHFTAAGAAAAASLWQTAITAAL